MHVSPLNSPSVALKRSKGTPLQMPAEIQGKSREIPREIPRESQHAATADPGAAAKKYHEISPGAP